MVQSEYSIKSFEDPISHLLMSRYSQFQMRRTMDSLDGHQCPCQHRVVVPFPLTGTCCMRELKTYSNVLRHFLVDYSSNLYAVRYFRSLNGMSFLFLGPHMELILDPNTKYNIAASRCFFSYTTSYASAGLWLKAAYDTSIFIAISVRIVSYSTVDHGSKLPLWRSFQGIGLPRVCRDLLHGGQLFYM